MSDTTPYVWLTHDQAAILRWIAHNAAEDRDDRDGWCRWGIPEGNPWEWDAYKPLVVYGLIERRETWKDVLLRPTDAAWSFLAVTPTDDGSLR
jgi:hypothetical protein